jgi:NAD(P)-dependent dehydrogenase (short-subunit alcohol dehydrogenase family)
VGRGHHPGERAGAVRRPTGEPETNEWLKQFVASTALGRYGDPETDIGHGIALLATNPFITGRSLMMDGGIGTFR